MRTSYNNARFSALVVFLFFGLNCLEGQVYFPSGSQYRYLKGKDAQYLNPGWMNQEFDDSGWSLGNAPFRYGDGDGGTVLSDMAHGYSVVYMRSSFNATQADSLEDFMMRINYDDGFVIWINGYQVLQRNAPSNLAYNETATENHESGAYELFEIDLDDVDLKEGENTIAIQGFNVSLQSSDFHFDMEFSASIIEPVLADTAGVSFSVPSGFYDTAFYLDIVSSNPDWGVLYTLDGSNPQDSESAIFSEGAARILIDPLSSEGRPLAPSVVVRASATDGIIKPALPESRSYLFLDQVRKQYNPRNGWPAAPVNEQVIDVQMDSEIVNHADYRDEIIPALLEIPTISVVTDLKHLFDAGTGIYVNAFGHGRQWERPCSVELIHPDGSEGFHANAGLRIRGGWSRHPEFPKHAFRLFFRSEYGDAKLRYPLFGEEGVDHFDKVDLRCAQNYSWANGNHRNTYLRDVFSRDLQRDMGQPYTRSRFYHLYLNGMYWGVYQTQERSEARYASDYFGGKPDDYDVIKVDTEEWVYMIEATDGNSDIWYEIWQMSEGGFASNESYFRLLGRDGNGEPVKGGVVYLDMDNLIDYMITIFYTGNFDSPTTTFRWNKAPNNFYAVKDRTDRSKGFIFFNHDAEHAMFAEEVEPGKGIREDRVNLTKRTDGRHMEVDHFGNFHPQWLHHKLTANIEYRIRFMDRAHKHFSEGGVLQEDANLERLHTRMLQIDTAIVAESARWGDARPWVSSPFTRNDHWIPEVENIRNDFFPYRNAIVINQLRGADLYSDLQPPNLSLDGQELRDEQLDVTGTYTIGMENQNGKGILVYTLDGSDPRMVGGGYAASATLSGENALDITLTGSALLKCRIFDQGSWSPIREVTLFSEQLHFDHLKITELHYHPDVMLYGGDTISGKDLEFIELKNTGTSAINLSGLVFDSAIYYAFPANALLPPGQFYVVASVPSDFYARYGMIASGNYKKNLSNSGEELVLLDPEGQPVIHLVYSDDMPWPIEADGAGSSLVSVEVNPRGNPAIPSYWRPSTFLGGSPFANDPYAVDVQDQIGEPLMVSVYPNPTSSQLFVKMNREAGEFYVSLLDLNGTVLIQERMEGQWNKNLSDLKLVSGLYFLRIQTQDQLITRKILYTR